MPTPHMLNKIAKVAESRIEAFIFWTRWMLTPAYLALCVCIAILSYKTYEELIELILKLSIFAEQKAVAQVLRIVDLVFVMNLVLMVLFVGYVNFVSRIHPKNSKSEDWPVWMGHLDYSGLKVQLLGSIIAVSAINLLRMIVELVDTGKVEGEKFLWVVIFHIVLLFSALIIAIINKLKIKAEDSRF